ncbi:unnamed protein product, partial [Prorocentrum cordatum]
DSEKKTRQEAKVRKNLRRNIFEALSGGFDFLSLGDAWKLPAPDKSEKLSSKALSQGKTQRRTRAETEPIPGRRLSREREANKKVRGGPREWWPGRRPPPPPVSPPPPPPPSCFSPDLHCIGTEVVRSLVAVFSPSGGSSWGPG